jgi:hypothetical protein
MHPFFSLKNIVIDVLWRRPRDGKNLTLPMIKQSLQDALHMSPMLASSLTNALRPLRRPDGTLDLKDTRRYNVIEHDASITRLDFHQGDNYTIRPELVEAIFNDAHGGSITLKTLAVSFKRRGKESREAGAPRLGIRMWFVKLLNLAGAINTTVVSGEMSREMAEALFLEERWTKEVLENKKKRSVLTLLGNAVKLAGHLIFG